MVFCTSIRGFSFKAFSSIRFKLHEISSAPVISLSGTRFRWWLQLFCSSTWMVLDGLLRFLIFSSFEHFLLLLFVFLRMEYGFLVAMAAAITVGNCRRSLFVSFALTVSFVASVPNFLTETVLLLIPFLLLSLSYLFGFCCGHGLGWLRCSVSALRVYIRRTPWWAFVLVVYFSFAVLMFLMFLSLLYRPVLLLLLRIISWLWALASLLYGSASLLALSLRCLGHLTAAD